MQRDLGRRNQFETIVSNGIVPFFENNFGQDIAEEMGLILVPGDLVANGRIYTQWAETFSNHRAIGTSRASLSSPR